MEMNVSKQSVKSLNLDKHVKVVRIKKKKRAMTDPISDIVQLCDKFRRTKVIAQMKVLHKIALEIKNEKITFIRTMEDMAAFASKKKRGYHQQYITSMTQHGRANRPPTSYS